MGKITEQSHCNLTLKRLKSDRKLKSFPSFSATQGKYNHSILPHMTHTACAHLYHICERGLYIFVHSSLPVHAPIWKLTLCSGTQTLQALADTPDGTETRYLQLSFYGPLLSEDIKYSADLENICLCLFSEKGK